MKSTLVLLLISSMFVCALAQTAPRRSSGANMPAGYWPLEKSQPLVDKTQTVSLAPDLSHLTAGERAAIEKLLEVGKIFQS
ncbi:MAG TPA: hypothetical protein VGC91_19750, partial [Pyrinomonadaceae bacterium]